MVISAADVSTLADTRYNSDYVSQERDIRLHKFSEWKKDISDLDAIIRGDWSLVYKGEVEAEKYDASLKVQNIIADSLQDMGRLAAETIASIRVDELGAGVQVSDKARLVESIAMGYWEANDGELRVQTLAMDLAGTGGAFLLSYPSSLPYPAHQRLDPRGCYPTLFEEELLDLLYVKKMKTRAALAKWPHLVPEVAPDSEEECEVIDYYSPEEIVKVIRFTHTPVERFRLSQPIDKALIAERSEGLGIMPVAFCKLPTFDGAWRGIFNQTGNILNAANRIMTLVLDNSEQTVYSPVLETDVANPEDYGPNAILHGTSDRARMERVSPAPVQGGLFALMGRLTEDARGSAIFPAGRQGEVSQSIASASFVASTQGQQTTFVRNIQKYLGTLRRRQTQADFAVERRYLDFEKPLLFSAGNKKTYLPGKDIPDQTRVRVVFGVGAGLDPMNRSVQINQNVGNRMISRQTGRENLDDVLDPAGEEIKIQQEQSTDLLFQLAASQASLSSFTQFVSELRAGKDIFEAAVLLQEREAAAAAAQPPPGPEVPPGAVGTAQEQALAQQKGAPAPPPLAPQLPLPPLTQVLVR